MINKNGKSVVEFEVKNNRIEESREAAIEMY